MRLRAATPDDTGAICRLLAEVFPSNPKAAPEVFAWQYWDNPFGAPASWVWEDAGRIVAHGGLFCVPGRLGGRDVVLGHAADAATAVGFRHRSLFAELTAVRYRTVGDRAALTLSLPNPNSLPGSRRAGLQVAGRVAAHARPVDVAALADGVGAPRWVMSAVCGLAFRGLGPPAGAEIRELPDGVDALWRRTADQRRGVRRNAAWWNWRYLEHPRRPYRLFAFADHDQLEGLVAVRVHPVRGTPFLHVMDLLASSRDVARGLLAAAASAHPKVGGVVALALDGDRQWAGTGLRRVPHRFDPQPMVLGIVDAAEQAAAHIGEPWQVSWGDHDHL